MKISYFKKLPVFFSLLACLFLGACDKDFFPENTFPIVQSGSRVEPRPDDLSLDQGVLSPVIIIPPLISCGKSVTVRGFVPGADIRIYAGGTLIGSAIGTEPEGQTILVAPDLVLDQSITAKQVFEGVEGPPSDAVVVKSPADVYPPSGIPPPPYFPFLPLYDCGVATFLASLPPGGILKVYAQNASGQTLIGQIDGCGGEAAIGVEPFHTGEAISAQTQICTNVSPFSEVHVVQPAPSTWPAAQVAAIYEESTIINIRQLVNGAKVTISRGTDIIGTFGAPANDVRAHLGVTVRAGDVLEIVQELCDISSRITTTVQPCSALPVAHIQVPRAGDQIIKVLDAVPGSRIRIFVGGQEIGDGGGSQIYLTRALDANETVVVLQSMGNCLSASVLTIRVGRGLTDPVTAGPCGDIERLDYGGGNDPDQRTTDIRLYLPTPGAGTPVGAMPLNGRVRYPSGSGPFPLVILLHGRHDPSSPSHEGYDYLLDHFASHCMIAVSIDENLLNGPSSGEMDARAILLLRHLQLWREWNQTPGHPFFGKVDMGKIGLAGHSRGGEAIAVAHLFNTRLHNPADPLHNFNFNIRGLYAIAPTDGQLQYETNTYGPPVALNNTDYYVMHGSHDADVNMFEGHKMYDRALPVDAPTSNFKGLLFIFGANHTHWNTVWESRNRERLVNPAASRISSADQKTIAKSYMTAFWLAALKGRAEYRYFLNGEATFGTLLPTIPRVTQFRDPSRVFVNHYQEDNNPATGSFPGVTNSTQGTFAVNREIGFIDFSREAYFLGSDLGTKGLVVAWQDGSTPELHIQIPPNLAEMGLNREFLALQTGQIFEASPNYNTPVADKNFTVQLVFDQSAGPEVEAASYARFPYPLPAAQLYYGTPDDPAPKSVLQTVRIPMERLYGDLPLEARGKLTEIIIKYNRSPKGIMGVDEIQFTN